MRSVADTLQIIAWEWGVRAFGREHMTDKKVRGLRFVEEAVELAQCLDVDKAKLHLLVDKVYERERGNVFLEIGGCMVTLSVICEMLNYTLESAFEFEVRRVLSKSPEHFAKRNEEKIDGGLS